MSHFMKSAVLGFSLLLLPAFASAASSAQDSDTLPPELELLLTTAAKNNADRLDLMRDTMIQAYPALEKQIIAFIKALTADSAKTDQTVKSPANEETVKAEADKKAAAAKEADATADAAEKEKALFDAKLWNMQVELGASSTTGDSQQRSLAFGVGLNRKFGKKWEHNLDIDVVLAEANGVSSTEQYLLKHEAIWRPWEKVFVLNFLQTEKNRFSGFDLQVTENLGIGYQFYNTEKLQLRIDAGPAIRYSTFTEAGVPSESALLGRLAADLRWKISDNFSITDKLSYVAAGDVSILDNKIEITAKFNASLAARLSHQVRYDSTSPLGTTKWDSISRITLVYDF